jgi:asparagine synthase (glutamine-hydrolysing)
MTDICGVFGEHNKNLISRMLMALGQRRLGRESSYISPGVSLATFCVGGDSLKRNKEFSYQSAAGLRIVFDGNIYNRIGLREKLIRKGRRFFGETDEELVIHAYKEHGEECVHLLKGDFAFVIEEGDKLFLARDRLGKRSLFYAFLAQEKLFIFASEIKAILQCEKISADLDEQGVLECTLGKNAFFKNSELTCIKGIKQLLQGTTLQLFKNYSTGKIDIKSKRYYTLLPPSEKHVKLNSLEAKNEIIQFQSLMENAFKEYMGQSCSPKAIMLSGGVDSSLLASFCSKILKGPLHSITMSTVKGHADLSFAKKVSRLIGSIHHELLVDYKDFLDNVADSILIAEKPSFLIMGMSVLSKRASGITAELICGEGPDEFFGGYLSGFEDVIKLKNTICSIAKTLRYLEFSGTPFAGRMADNLKDLLPQRADAEQQLIDALDFYCRDSLTNMHLWLFDRAARRYGLEGRLPYLADDLIEATLGLPFNLKLNKMSNKYILRKILKANLGDKKLAYDIMHRKKIGFPFALFSHRKQLAIFADKFIKDDYVNSHPYKRYLFKKKDILAFDLFFYIFVKNKGWLPSNFDLLDFCKTNYNRKIRM